MSKQKRPKTFIHTITVSGVVYILRFEQLGPQRYAVTSLTAELIPFQIAHTGEGWRITEDMPHREQFEELLKERMYEEVG